MIVLRHLIPALNLHNQHFVAYNQETRTTSASPHQVKIIKTAPLTLAKVFTQIRDQIAKVEGRNSQKIKTGTMQKLIADGERDEVKYLVRSFQARLRVGINRATILTSLAHAAVMAKFDRDENLKITRDELETSLTNMEEGVKTAYCQQPNYEKVANALLNPDMSAEELKKACRITPGIPLKPMLAKPSKGISEVKSISTTVSGLYFLKPWLAKSAIIIFFSILR